MSNTENKTKQNKQTNKKKKHTKIHPARVGRSTKNQIAGRLLGYFTDIFLIPVSVTLQRGKTQGDLVALNN